MKRGLTLLELMLSISLLSLLMLAVVSWSTAAARSYSLLSERVVWRTTAGAALQVIADDLRAGDFGSRLRSPKVAVRGSTLTIQTRDSAGSEAPGPLVRAYGHEARTGEVQVRERRIGAPQQTRTLVGGVSEWKCAIIGPVLVVTLTSVSGERATRRFNLP